MRALLLQAILLIGISMIAAFSFTHWLAGAVLAPVLALALIVIGPRLLALHAAFAPDISTRG